MPLLILQFLIGMFANLFVTFSTSTDPNPLAVIFTAGSPALMLHVLIAVILLILALLVLVSASFTHRRRLVATVSAGFASIAIAFFSGIAFVYSGYTNDSLSYLMAVGFLFGLIIYGNFAGRGEQEPNQEMRGETGPSHTTQPGARPLGLTVLQLIAGGIVVFGGFALIGFNPGTINLALGSVTLLLGLLSFLSAYAIWTSKIWSVTLARLVNPAIVLFSTSQEAYTIATATAANTVAGSLGGTVIAVGLCMGVVLNLPNGPLRS
ncbi:hypothetical protein AUF78_01760 [archaeon 13_1_20CM_2_51_12]|nr:MAG: hypothetical protein AUF78_01760 [archaeon 13_1_20CM_2_51_12]